MSLCNMHRCPSERHEGKVCKGTAVPPYRCGSQFFQKPPRGAGWDLTRNEFDIPVPVPGKGERGVIPEIYTAPVAGCAAGDSAPASAARAGDENAAACVRGAVGGSGDGGTRERENGSQCRNDRVKRDGILLGRKSIRCLGRIKEVTRILWRVGMGEKGGAADNGAKSGARKTGRKACTEKHQREDAGWRRDVGDRENSTKFDLRG
ncbi:hypothetical protein B0H11DRAFT_2183198 [Mycena galericulata]|nr:hypothetical protein B0H11DRAFT_2183198 [Mycena galericulata]